MKEKIKTQKGFIQIPLLIAIIISSLVISVGAYSGFEYYKVSKAIKEAGQLTSQEQYQEATEKLMVAQVSWFSKSLGIKKEKIKDKIKKNEILLLEKLKIDEALSKFDEGNWQESINLLAEIPDSSLYYQKATIKTEEAKRKILEQRSLEVQEEIMEIERERLELQKQQFEQEQEIELKLNNCLSEEKQRYQDIWDNYLKPEAPLKISGSDWYKLWKRNEEMHDEEITKCYQWYSSK